MKKLMHIAMVALLAGAAVLYTGCTKDYTGEVKDLQSVTSSLQSQVDALKATDQSLQNAINQANTLINDLKTKEANDIAGINTLIAGINESIADLQAKDIEILETIAKLELAIKEGDEKTLADAKKYADEQIAKMADDLTVLINGEATERKSADETLKGLIDGLVANLDQEILDRKAEDAALASADAGLQQQINTVNGLVSQLSQKEAEDVQALYGKISSEVATINETIDGVNERIAELETLVGKLVNSFKGRIQSIVAIVPGVGMPAEAVTYSFAGTDTTEVEMKFNVSPAAAAAKVTKENATLVVTESEVSTRAEATPDYCKEYVPTSVTVSGNVVTVKALVAPKTSSRNNYWVSLKVADTDEVEAPVEVISSPVKATEENVRLSTANLKWYTTVDGEEVPVKVAVNQNAYNNLVGFEDIQYVDKRGNAPRLVLATDKQNYTEAFVTKAPFAAYYLKVEYRVNGKPVAKTLPEVAAMFGTEFELTSDDSVEQIYGYIVEEDDVPGNKFNAFETDLVEFAVSEGAFPAKTAGFSYKVEGDVKTREAVGIVGVYAEGAKLDASKNITFPGMKINGKAVKNLAACYAVRIAKDAKVVYPISAPIVNVWDYSNFEKTNTTTVENGNGVFTNLAWNATTATEFEEGEADEIRIVNDGVEGRKKHHGTFSIERTAAGYVTATVDKVPVEEDDVDYVAIFKKSSFNAKGVEYYSYDTKVNFSVEGRHADVAKTFEVPTFVPAQSYDSAFEVKNFYATVFADEADWFGSLPTSDATKAKAKSIAFYNVFKALKSEIAPTKVTVDGVEVAALKRDVKLVLGTTKDSKKDSVWVEYKAASFKYGSDYVITFKDATKFDVDFVYTVKFTTAAAPAFYLDYTAVVDPKDSSVVVKGEVLEGKYILEDLHIAKYFQVAGTIDPKETLTIECVGKKYRAQNIGAVAEYNNSAEQRTFTETGKLDVNADFYFSWNKNFLSNSWNGDLKDTEFVAYFVMKAGNTVVPVEKGVKVKVGGVDVLALPIYFSTATPITVSATAINHSRKSGVVNNINVLKTLSVKGIVENKELWKYNSSWTGYTDGFGTWKIGEVSYGQSLLKQIFGETGYNVCWDEMEATFDGRAYEMVEGVDYSIFDQTLTLLDENAKGTIVIKVPVEISHYFDQNGAKPEKVTVTINSVLQ